MSPLAVASLAILGAIAACGAWLDMRHRLLPNWLALVAMVTGLGFAAWTGGWSTAGLALAHGVVALLVGMGLFAVRWIGGGDAKFYAGIACWFPITQALFLLVSVSLVGLVLAIGMLVILRRKPPHGGLSQSGDDAFRQVPFGVAIALGALVAFAMKGAVA